MSRSRRLGALLLALALAGPAASASELIAPEKIVADEVRYKTCTAEPGEYVKSVTVGASEYYPLVMTVNYKGDPAVYAETLVKRGQEVKKGDPLLRVTVLYDAVQMAELELALQRAQEDFEAGKDSRREAIDAAERALAAEKDEYSRRVQAAQLKRQKLALEQYIYQQEYALDSRRRQLDDLNERHGAELVFSPMDGVVADLTYFREGDRLYNGTMVCRIASQDVMLLAVRDHRLRYGMPVTVEAGPNKEKVYLTGHVVAAADCLDGVVSDYALVEVDPYEGHEKINWRVTKVTGDIVRLDGVLMIDRKAISLDGGNYIVTKLTPDGVTQKRYINQAQASNTQTWVLQGLEAGDVVIID